MIGENRHRAIKRRGLFGRHPEVSSGGGQVGGVPLGAFRRTLREREAPPPREVVTAKLLGDPAPDRVVPDIPDAIGSGGSTAVPAPIYLTFREYEAALAREENR